MKTEVHEAIFVSFEDWVYHSLIEADELLEPEVAAQILEHCAAAVAPLVMLLGDRGLLDAPEGAWAPMHAAVLLGELRAIEAIPVLLAALADEGYRDFFAEEAVQALTAMGPAALEPVLQAHASSSDRDHLMDLESILCSLGIRDERILTTLLGALEREPEYGACCLALYGDERAIEPLHQAFDRCDLDVDVWSGDIEAANEIRAAIQRLGGALTEEQAQKYWRAREKQLAEQRSRFGHERAAAGSKQKRRAARKRQKASRKKNRR